MSQGIQLIPSGHLSRVPQMTHAIVLVPVLEVADVVSVLGGCPTLSIAIFAKKEVQFTLEICW